jgi:CO/xanthine dehydrogenase Mo-binding subunit
MMTKVLGTSIPRADIPSKVRGTRKYPGDFNMAGQFYGKVVWAAHPHARVVRIDTAAAEALPGVVRVITAKDVPVNEYSIAGANDQRVFIPEGDKVRWLGDRIALVVAETEAIAEQSRALVRVDYEVLPVVDDPRKAMEPGAPLVQENRESNVLCEIHIHHGDIAAGFAQADVVVEGTYITPCVEHAYTQPDAGIGYIDEQGRVTVIDSGQWPHDDVHQIAHILNLPTDQVHEIIPAVGGAFGGREDMHIQHLLAVAAFAVRRPVKIVFTREEVTTRTGKRHPFAMTYRHGAKRDGTLVAVEARCVADAGAYTSTTVAVLNNGASFMAGPYRVPHAKIDVYGVFTNNAVTMAMRGFGATQPPVGYEAQMTKLAEALGMDPVEFRLKNLIREGEPTITGNPMHEGLGLWESCREAALAAGWREETGHWIRPDLGQPSAPWKRRGIGLACTFKNVGFSFGFDDKSTATVELALDEGGAIAGATVKCGTTDVGEGIQTVLIQFAAETLDVPPDRVRFALVDTAQVPDAGSVSASRHTYMSGNAVVRACQAALEERERVLRAETGETTVSATATYHGRSERLTTGWGSDPTGRGQCNPHIGYGGGTQIALVEVDTETGETEILKMWAAHNVGKAVNPEMIVGQINGGIHMGVGYALTEEYVQIQGVPRTRRLSEYQIPTVWDMPREIVPIILEIPDPAGPYGATGVGEMTTLGTAPAIAAAIHDAVGVWMDRLPATAERVYLAMKRKPSSVKRDA